MYHACTWQVTLPHPLLFPEGKPYAVIAEDCHRRCVRITQFSVVCAVVHWGQPQAVGAFDGYNTHNAMMQCVSMYIGTFSPF